EVHSYPLTLTAGQFLQLTVEQLGIDVALILCSPGDGRGIRVDSPGGERGPEPLSLVTEVAGTYRLRVASLHSKDEDLPGRYQIRLLELRGAKPEDRRRVMAEQTFAEGSALYQARGGQT